MRQHWGTNSACNSHIMQVRELKIGGLGWRSEDRQARNVAISNFRSACHRKAQKTSNERGTEAYGPGAAFKQEIAAGAKEGKLIHDGKILMKLATLVDLVEKNSNTKSRWKAGELLQMVAASAQPDYKS